MKRILSLALVLVLALSLIPFNSVYAAAKVNEIGATEILAKDNDGSLDASTGSSVRIEAGCLSFDSKDWAEFTISAPKDGAYNVTFFTRRPAGTTIFNISVNGVEQGNVETTTGIDWNTAVETDAQLTLSKGSNTVRITNGGGTALYFYSMVIEYSVKPLPSRISGWYRETYLPTTIEAEDYDLGQSGSYSVDGVNDGKRYRKTDPVNIYDNGVGGYYVDLAQTEYAVYSFEVKHSGPYTLHLAPNAIGEGEIYFDDAIEPVEVMAAGDKESSFKCVYFEEGIHKMKVVSSDKSFKYDYIRFSQGGEDAVTIDELKVAEPTATPAFEGETKEEHPIYKELWVAENGADESDGTKDSPFKTLERALSEIASLNDDMTGDIIVNIMEGSYHLKETLKITTEHSGKNGFDVIFKGTNKDNPPIVHGGTKLTNWSEYKDGIYKTTVDGDVEYLRNLYIDGQPAIRARSKYMYALKENWKTDGKKSGGFVLDVTGNNFPEISKPYELETVWPLTWFAQRLLVDDITRVDDETIIMHMKQPMFDVSQAQTTQNIAVMADKACFIENAIEFLDEPGEFYYDKDTKTVYYYPYKEQDLNTSEVYAPTTEYLVDINGNSIYDLVTNITFDNIDFRYGAWNDTSKEGFLGSQATHIIKGTKGHQTNHTMPGQFMVNRADNINVLNSRFSCMTAVAVLYEDAVSNSTVNGNAFWNLGATGVIIDTFDHDPHFNSDDSRIPNMRQCENITVSNNICRRVALDYYGCVGIHAYYPKNIKIYHNDISDVPYTGMSVGWGWGVEELKDWNFDVSYNKVVGVNKYLSDGANLYTLGETTGSIISYNYFADNGDYRGGVYNDSGSRNIDIFKNVFEDVGRWWFQGSYYTKNIKAYDNFSERVTITDRTDTNNTHQNEIMSNGHTLLPDGVVDGEALEIKNAAGLEPEYYYLFDIISFPEWMANPATNVPRLDYDTSRLNWYQAEDFMLGGEGVGYHKITPAISSAYRPNEGVDLYKDFTSMTTDYVVSTNFDTEWWAYQVEVPNDGEYNIAIRAAQAGWGSACDVYVDGELVTKKAELVDPGNHWIFKNTNVATVNLTKGVHIVKIVINGGSFYFDALAVTPSDIPLVAEPNTIDEGKIISQEELTAKKVTPYLNNKVEFTDMKNHWAKKDVELLANGNIIYGIGDNLFAPDSELTKKQATLLTLRSLKIIYSDETEADWLNLAVKNGILKNTENLDGKISREQFAEILAGAVVYKKGALKVDILKASFDDFESVSSYYKTSVLGVAGVGLMTGDDQGLFSPKKTLTRAEAARTMKRLIYLN